MANVQVGSYTCWDSGNGEVVRELEAIDTARSVGGARKIRGTKNLRPGTAAIRRLENTLVH